MNKHLVRVDVYEEPNGNADVRVFVAGHALSRENRTFNIANHIAKEAGQVEIPVTTYRTGGPPRKELFEVY